MKNNVLQTVLISVLFLIPTFLIPVCVKAATQSDYSITLEFVADRDKDPTPVPGSEFRLYRVLDENSKLTDEFVNLDIMIGDLSTSEELDALTADLLTKLDEVVPYAKGQTDAKGKVVYNDIEGGLYLYVGSTVTVDNVHYTPKSSLIWIPYESSEGILVTEVSVEVKYESVADEEPVTTETPTTETPTSTEITTIDRSVVKVWEDDNNPNRPTEVTIELLEDGAVFDTVTLSAETYWKYTWIGLDADADWQVREVNVPEGYSAQITQSGMVFTVTNTLDDETPEQPSTDTDEKLPQTGQLWWPVLIFAVLGLGLFLVGIVAKNLNNEEK